MAHKNANPKGSNPPHGGKLHPDHKHVEKVTSALHKGDPYKHHK